MCVSALLALLLCYNHNSGRGFTAGCSPVQQRELVTVTVNQDKALQPVIKRVEIGETKQAPIFKLQIYDEGHFQHSSVILNASMFSTFNNKPNSCLCSSYSFLCLFTCQREHMEFSVLPHSTLYLAGMNKLLYQMCMTHLLIISAPKRPKKG